MTVKMLLFSSSGKCPDKTVIYHSSVLAERAVLAKIENIVFLPEEVKGRISMSLLHLSNYLSDK